MQQEGRQILGEEGRVGQARQERAGARSKNKIGQVREGGRIGDEKKKSRMSVQMSWIYTSKGMCCLEFSCFPDLVSSPKAADHHPILQQSKPCILLNSECRPRHCNIPTVFHGPTRRLSEPPSEYLPYNRVKASSVKDIDKSYSPAYDRIYLEIARARMNF